LFEEDSYRFAVGLLALLAEGKRVYIPGENHVGIVEELSVQGVRFLGMFPTAEKSLEIGCGDVAPASPIALCGEIVVFTSGSTGNAKSIPKSLAQVDSELLAQEDLWGERLGAAGIMGTVSHQHFYGLLFCVLWPLCAGRCFWRRPFVDPVAMARQAASLERSAWVMSPAHLHRLGIDMPWESLDNSLAVIFSSGGPLAGESARKIFGASGHLPVEIFGSSETGGIAWRQHKTEKASWTPLPGVEITFSEMGALRVRSPFLPTEDWYTTDDAAVPAPEGGFTLGDRLDRIVKIEGKRVSLP
jgi:acyl-coenzyme A synthetase/AMP-(fatty) acid ligase